MLHVLLLIASQWYTEKAQAWADFGRDGAPLQQLTLEVEQRSGSDEDDATLRLCFQLWPSVIHSKLTDFMASIVNKRKLRRCSLGSKNTWYQKTLPKECCISK